MPHAANDATTPLIDFEPIFNDKEMHEAEAAAKAMGVQRRIALAVATKSRVQLVKMVLELAQNDEEPFFEMLDGLKSLIQHYEGCIELFKATEARLLLAASQAFDVELN